MRTAYTVALTALACTVSAWEYDNGSGLGFPKNETPFRDAIQQANTSRSVPFSIGSRTFQFQVNVTNLQIPGADVPQEDPSTVFTLYSLLWDRDSDLNATISEAQGLSEDEEPRLCSTIPLGLFSASVTNGYSEDDEGDCSGALGQQCVDDLTSTGFGGVLNDCTPPNLPVSCLDKSPGGGLGTGSALNNETRVSPVDIAWHAEAAETGSPAEREAFSSAVNRLHMVIFAGRHSYFPVCMRIQDDKVSNGDPSTGSAVSQWSSVSWPLVATFTLLLAVFLSP